MMMCTQNLNEKASHDRTISRTLHQGPGKGPGLQCQGQGQEPDQTVKDKDEHRCLAQAGNSCKPSQLCNSTTATQQSALQTVQSFRTTNCLLDNDIHGSIGDHAFIGKFVNCLNGWHHHLISVARHTVSLLQLTKAPFTRYNLLSNPLSNRLYNRFDNRLYRVNGV